MNFEEKLGTAKNGSRAAYESLCLRFADKLYAAALLSLKNSGGAEKAVSDAIDEGFDSISRIKDERHLCSWLVHELTKFIVDALKEYKANGTSYTAAGSLAPAEKMPDVERLVFAVSSVFGYSEREISVLLGMPENVISDKLTSAKQHLGTGYDRVIKTLSSAQAPAALLKKRLSAYDGQNSGGSLSEVLNISGDESEDTAAAEETDSEDKPYSPEIPTAVLFGDEEEEPVHTESRTAEPEAEEAVPEPEEIPEEAPAEEEVPETGEIPEETSAEEEVPETGEIREEVPAEEADVVPGNDDESVFAEEYEREEPASDDDSGEAEEYYESEPEKSGETDDIAGGRLDAATFIAVVSAERMKGSEFLRLIGNTRISNSAFREIESNPKLTKSRLIELLESSPLTENDYYKMLTAIKERREVLDAKEENRLALEKAGLYDGSRRKKRRRRAPPKTELQMAIGMSDARNPEQEVPGLREDPDPVRTEQYRPGYQKPPVPVQPSMEFRIPEPEETPEPVKISVQTADEVQVDNAPAQPETSENGRRKIRQKNIRKAEETASVPPSLGDIVSVVPRSDIGFVPDEEHPDDDGDGAVDPFAEIAAKEIRRQEEPEEEVPQSAEEETVPDEAAEDKTETGTAEENTERHEPAPEAAAEETADGEAEEKTSVGTIEFDLPLTSISDTKTFDKIIPIPFENELPVTETSEPAAEMPKPEAKHTDKWAEPLPVPSADDENDIQPFRVDIPGIDAADDDEQDYDFEDGAAKENSKVPEPSDTDTDKPVPVQEAAENIAVEAVGTEETGEEKPEEIIGEVSAAGTGEDEAPEEPEPEPQKQTEHRPDLSVTQIISDYAIGESNPYVNDIIDPEGEELSGGYAPDVDLVFESGRKHGRKEEVLEFTSELILDRDTSEDEEEEEEITVGSLRDKKRSHDDEYEETLGITEPPEFNDDREAAEEIAESDVRTVAEETVSGYVPETEPEEEPGTDMSVIAANAAADDAEDEEEEAPERPRYKGSEYFYDDNKYYDGVNKGKVIACAVCAVLLTAGSVGMKFLAKPTETAPVQDSPAVTEEAPQTETSEEAAVPAQSDAVFSEEAELTKLSALTELTGAGYDGSFRASANTAEAGYMRASAEPYAPRILPGSESGVITDGNSAYIYANDYFRKVTLARADSAEPAVQPEPVRVDGTAVRGYTVIFGELYVISENRNAAGTSLHETTVTVYDDMLSKKDEYTVTGDYAGAVVLNGKLVIAAVYAPDKADEYYGGKKPSSSKNGVVSELSASDIYAIDGAKHNALHIVYSVGGKAAAVLGGYTDGYRDPEKLCLGKDGVTLLAVDDGVSYAVDITEDMEVKEAKCYMGEAFGVQCLGDGALIGQLPDGGGITAYKNGTYISTQPEDGSAVSENARNIAWSDNGVAFVVAEQDKTAKLLYGFDMSGDSPAPADVTSDYIYTDRLSAAGDHLVGLKAEPTPDGERAGLRLSLYSYDNGLKETAYSIIELDKDTSRDNLKYLSSPAEANSSFIAVDETGTLYAVPTVYFDGFSEVERIVILRYDGAVFSQIGEHMMYDEKSSVLCPVFMNGDLYIITDTKLITLALSE